MSKVIAGGVYPTQYSGDITVLSIDGNKCLVRFINSGNEKEVVKCNILVKKVSDKEQHRKEYDAIVQIKKDKRDAEKASRETTQREKASLRAVKKESDILSKEAKRKEKQTIREAKLLEVSERKRRTNKKTLLRISKAEHREAENLISRALIEKAGFYSKSILNDVQDEAGLWLKHVNADGKSFATRTGAVWGCVVQRGRVGGAYQTRWPLYEGVTVCKEWEEDFQSFARWYTSQPGYKYGYGWDIDKDFRTGGRHYSPETCMLLPRKVNLLLADKCFTDSLVDATKKNGIPRWRTRDGECFTDYSLAKQRNVDLKVKHVEEVRSEYEPQGVPSEVFEHILTRLSLI